jgi:hypothetical protein
MTFFKNIENNPKIHTEPPKTKNIQSNPEQKRVICWRISNYTTECMILAQKQTHRTMEQKMHK